MTGPDQPDHRPDPAAGAGTGGAPHTSPPGTRAQARDELLARLAGQVRTGHADTDRRLRALEATTAESADLLAQALPRIDTAVDQLAALAAQLDPPAGRPAPVCWPTLTAAQAATVWAQLADWSEHVLVGWYGITRAQLPDCWALHRPVVLELTWLHTAYREAHAPGARAGLAADWHTRWLPAALGAIAASTGPNRGTLTSGCRPGRHLDPTGQLPDQLFTPPPDEPADGRYREGRDTQLARREFWQTNYLTAARYDHDQREQQTTPGPR